MKKVLVLVAAIALFATPAMASSVVDSLHNLSTAGPGTVKSDNYDEVCVFCHTPHSASTTVSLAPLWNRTDADTSITSTTELYNSSTLEPTSRPSATGVLAGVQNSDAPLCFSCHDGTSLTNALVNPSNLAGGQPTWANTNMTTAELLEPGTMLTNDHPIGINYSAAASTDGELQATPLNSLDVSYGATGKDMWCSSCHDVHDDANYPFLAFTNAQSALCLSCHIK
jgi:predicted CXXCH cytochrome family protein